MQDKGSAWESLVSDQLILEADDKCWSYQYLLEVLLSDNRVFWASSVFVFSILFFFVLIHMRKVDKDDVVIVETQRRLSKQEKKELKRQKMIDMKHRKYERQKERKKQRMQVSATEITVSDEEIDVLQDADCNTNAIIYGPRKRDLLAQRLTNGMERGVRICIDLVYDDLIHNYRERSSLVKQLTLCYAYLKQSEACVHLNLASVNPASQLTEKMHKMGFENWLVSRHEKSPEEIWLASQIVILSPDAEETLDDLEADKVYVIGGIVDRTVRKATTLKAAEKIGAQTRRLPIKEHLGSLVTHVLNVDHVFRILCDYAVSKNWKEAILRQVPQRRIQQNCNDQLEQSTEI